MRFVEKLVYFQLFKNPFIEQKKLCQKTLTKTFMSKPIFFVKKKFFLAKSILVKKDFGSKKILVRQIFGENKFWSKQIYGQNNFWSKKFWLNNFLVKFFLQLNFGRKISSFKKFFLKNCCSKKNSFNLWKRLFTELIRQIVTYLPD